MTLLLSPEHPGTTSHESETPLFVGENCLPGPWHPLPCGFLGVYFTCPPNPPAGSFKKRSAKSPQAPRILDPIAGTGLHAARGTRFFGVTATVATRVGTAGPDEQRESLCRPAAKMDEDGGFEVRRDVANSGTSGHGEQHGAAKGHMVKRWHTHLFSPTGYPSHAQGL